MNVVKDLSSTSGAVNVKQKVFISESELLMLLSEKKREGFEILYTNYAATLFGVIDRILKNREMAEDVLSETFLKISNNFNQYNPSKGRLFTWMMNIARHLSIDKLRSKEYKKGLKTYELDSSNEAMGQHATSVEPSHMDLKTVTSLLEPAQRFLIDLAFFKGYTHAEIAEEFNIPIGTVKTRIRKAILELRKVFNHHQSSDISA